MTIATTPLLTPERAEQARRYRMAGYRLLLVRLVLKLAFLAALVDRGAGALWALLPALIPYVIALVVGWTLVTWPVSYYQHRLARDFGLSLQSDGSWLADMAKSLLLTVAVNGTLCGLLLVTWDRWPATWHYWAIIVGVAFNLLLNYVTPVLIAPLFNEYTPLADGELKDRLLRLSAQAGVFVRGVFVADASRKQTAINAALTGIGSTRRIVLYDTMIQACTAAEIEVVLAHELGHHIFQHIPKLNLAVSGFLAAVFLIGGQVLAPLSHWLGLGGLTPQALPLVALLFIVVGTASLPPLMAFMRQAERDCDAFALKMSGNPAAFITAFRKLADKNLAHFTPPRWYYFFFASHPPIPERVAMAEGWR